MSVRCISHAFMARNVTPLGKLILIRFGDTHSDGCGQADVERLADFCGVSQEDIRAELVSLVDSGHLTRLGADWFAMAGLPEDPVRKRSVYTTKIVSKAKRNRVFERDGHTCKTCGSTADLSVDHVIPQRLGGTHDLDNLQTLCRSCNSRKGVRRG